MQDKEREYAEEHASSPSDTSYSSLLEARCLLSLHFSDLAHSEAKHRANYFSEGDKNGKLQARLVAVDNQETNIPVIRGRGGDLISDPSAITLESRDFFADLCAPIPD